MKKKSKIFNYIYRIKNMNKETIKYFMKFLNKKHKIKN